MKIHELVCRPVRLRKVVSIYWGEICPRSDPDIAHMGYYLDPNIPMAMLFGSTLIFPWASD